MLKCLTYPGVCSLSSCMKSFCVGFNSLVLLSDSTAIFFFFRLLSFQTPSNGKKAGKDGWMEPQLDFPLLHCFVSELPEGT